MHAGADTQTDPVVRLTDNAVNEIRSLSVNDPQNAGKHLRVYVEAGGCSGLQYGMVFDEKRDGDVTAEFAGLSVLVDSFSAEYLRGAVVDYVDSLTGGGFKISNPQAKTSCGCGKSFEA